MQDLNKNTVKQLKKIAKEMKLIGYSKLRKAELVVAITKARAECYHAANQEVRILSWVALIQGRYASGRLNKKVLAVSHVTQVARVNMNQQIELGQVADGCIVEWCIKGSNGSKTSGFSYYKDGQPVAVSREFVELLV